MSIRIKLLLLFIVTLSLLGGVSVYMTSFYRDVTAAEQDVLRVSTQTIELGYRIEAHSRAQRNEWKNLLLQHQSGESFNQILKRFTEQSKASESAILALIGLLEENKVVISLIEDLLASHRQADQVFGTLIRQLQMSGFDRSILQHPRLAWAEQRSLELIDRIVHFLNAQRTEELASLHAYRTEQELFLFALFIVLILLSLVAMLWVINKNIAQPAQRAAYLADVIDSAQKIARFGTWDWDSRKDEHYWSDGFYDVLGLRRENRPSTELFISQLEPVERERVNGIFEAANRDCSSFEFEAKLLRDDGARRVISQRGEVRRIGPGRLRMTSLIFDITELKAAEGRLSYLANFDSLTGLPNRALFLDRLDHAVSVAKRNESKIALIFLDLDQFKAVNDAMGHSAGDSLLIKVAERIKAALRDMDTAARLGGDEFTVLLERVDSLQSVKTVAENLLATINNTYSISGQDVFVSTSMGITLFPDDADDSEVLLRNADTAMYLAKDSGRSGYQFFTRALNQKAQKRLVMENDLRKALGRSEFQLYFQPMIDLKTGRVVCAEALLRWFSGGEVLSPIDFIPTLEETGLIVSVGDWVLEQACTHAKSWQSRGIANMRVAVNLSVRQLRQKDMIERVEMILKRTGLPPGNLELEVTESTLIDGDVIGENLKGIEALGVRLAIDDFGTGYSSLSYLKEYAVDGLKIDRSFIRDINADINDDEVTSAVVGLSKALGMNVVAEGVETIEQYGFLERLNCQTIQGFLISLPLAAAEFEDWIGKLRKDADHSVYWRPPFVL